MTNQTPSLGASFDEAVRALFAKAEDSIRGEIVALTARNRDLVALLERLQAEIGRALEQARETETNPRAEDRPLKLARTRKPRMGLADKLRAHLEASPGQRTEEIAEALGVPTKAIKWPLHRMVKDGTATKSGIKRATRYFPVKV